VMAFRLLIFFPSSVLGPLDFAPLILEAAARASVFNFTRLL
jgi:hypothetical protein